ncbi:MAG: hypothetical protein ABFD81_07115 [Syntrophaceae bacterium]
MSIRVGDETRKRRKPTLHWSVQETADILHISPGDVWKEISNGRLIMEDAGITRKSLIRRLLNKVAHA